MVSGFPTDANNECRVEVSIAVSTIPAANVVGGSYSLGDLGLVPFVVKRADLVATYVEAYVTDAGIEDKEALHKVVDSVIWKDIDPETGLDGTDPKYWWDENINRAVPGPEILPDPLRWAPAGTLSRASRAVRRSTRQRSACPIPPSGISTTTGTGTTPTVPPAFS